MNRIPYYSLVVALAAPLAGGSAYACRIATDSVQVAADVRDGSGSSPRRQPDHPPVPEPEVRRKVDLVLALDTSSSMDGLIDSAKARLWDVVNELSRAKPTPELRVALYTFGNTGYDAQSGWVRKDSDFTNDLDALYQKLAGVTTGGGTEYVARVTKAAIDDLSWDESKSTLKILFVAGNEAADQDPEYDVMNVAKQAISKGIAVNTIYCGGAGDSVAAGWASVARAADGKYAVIDQNAGVKIASTPMDQKLADLSRKLNATYIGYTEAAAPRAAEQARSDASAASMGAGVAASRAAAKSTALYDNSEWDLVDARKKGKKVKLEEVPAAALPEPMREMSGKEREQYVSEMSKKRDAIQSEIAALSADREKFIKREEAKQKSGVDSLDDVLKASIREQAKSAGFTFEN